MAVKKIVSPSRRGEGSRIKPKAKRVSPSMRKEGSKRVAPTKPSKIQESGVGNLPMTLAKGAIALYGKYGPKTKTGGGGTTSRSPGSAVAKRPGSSIVKRPGSAVAKRPGSAVAKRPSGTVAKRPGGTGGVNTFPIKRAGAEGPKRKGKKMIYGAVGAGAGGAVLYGATRGSEGPKRATNRSKVGNKVWNGTSWVTKKK